MPRKKNRNREVFGFITLLIVVALSAQQAVIAATDWHKLDSVREVLKRGYQFFKLDTGGLAQITGPLAETLAIAICGTLLAGLLALGIIFMGKREPSTQAMVIGAPLRWLLTASRAVHEVVWGLLFVWLLGPGLIAGVLALALRSLSPLVQGIAGPGRPALRDVPGATGAGASKTLLSEWADNLARAAVLGLVGAGGLGLEFYRNVVQDNFGRATVALLVILGLIGAGQLLVWLFRARSPDRWQGVNTVAPAPDTPAIAGQPSPQNGLGAATGLLAVIAGAIVVAVLQTFGMFPDPGAFTGAGELHFGSVMAGLVLAVSESVQMLIVALAAGVLSAAVVFRFDAANKVRLPGPMLLIARGAVGLTLAVPAMLLVLPCRTVFGTGPLACVLALWIAAAGLAGRELLLSASLRSGPDYYRLAINVFAGLLPAALIIGILGGGGAGWYLKLSMHYGEPVHSVGLLVTIIGLMLLSHAGCTGLSAYRELPGTAGTSRPLGGELRGRGTLGRAEK